MSRSLPGSLATFVATGWAAVLAIGLIAWIVAVKGATILAVGSSAPERTVHG